MVFEEAKRYYFFSIYLIMYCHNIKILFSLCSGCSSWKDLTIPRTNEDDILVEKKERAMKYNNFRLQKYVFHHWHTYVKAQKEQLKGKSIHSSNYFLYSYIQRIKANKQTNKKT